MPPSICSTCVLLIKKSEVIENKLHQSQKNEELIELLELQKSLVYFTTSLRSNEVVLEKLLRIDKIKKYPEDTDLLEDVIVENKQAMEMTSIYNGILSGTMDTFASVISNNLNIVMKFLATVTIVLSIPTMVASFYGMNVHWQRGLAHLQTAPMDSGSSWDLQWPCLNCGVYF